MHVFDIIGPVMIGPSSSHTAGAVRLGNVAHAMLKEPPVRGVITLCGSFAKTGRGHGTDRALTAGIMGMRPDDTRIRDSLRLAQEQGFAVSFRREERDGVHPNTAILQVEGASGRTITVEGASVGGGSICVTKLNGMPVEISGESTTVLVLHEDVPGVIAAVTNFLAACGLNIAAFRMSHHEKGELALMSIELDGDAPDSLCQSVENFANVRSCTLLHALAR